MQLDKALTLLRRHEAEHSRRPLQLVVEVHHPGSVGGTPCVSVESIQAGFDWDAGKLLIKTGETLTTLSPEDVEAIHQSVAQGQSWHAFQAYKTQRDEITRLEAEVARLTALLDSRP